MGCHLSSVRTGRPSGGDEGGTGEAGAWRRPLRYSSIVRTWSEGEPSQSNLARPIGESRDRAAHSRNIYFKINRPAILSYVPRGRTKVKCYRRVEKESDKRTRKKYRLKIVHETKVRSPTAGCSRVHESEREGNRGNVQWYKTSASVQNEWSER